MLLLAPSCVPRLPFAVSAAEGKLAEAETLQGTVASTMSGTLERKMGIATNKIQMSVQDLVRSWDINKDGDIQPIEFRKAIRNSLKIQATNQEIDDLFKSLDLDGMQRRSNATPLERLERLEYRLEYRLEHRALRDAQAYSDQSYSDQPHPLDLENARAPQAVARWTSKR